MYYIYIYIYIYNIYLYIYIRLSFLGADVAQLDGRVRNVQSHREVYAWTPRLLSAQQWGGAQFTRMRNTHNNREIMPRLHKVNGVFWLSVVSVSATGSPLSWRPLSLCNNGRWTPRHPIIQMCIHYPEVHYILISVVPVLRV